MKHQRKYSAVNLQSPFLNETSSLTKWKRGEQSHSWFFNLPFVPCSGPQENPVMAKISCVFNMQDTHTHTLGISRSIHFPLTCLQIITRSRQINTHTVKLSDLTFLHSMRDFTPMSILCSSPCSLWGEFLFIPFPVCNLGLNLWCRQTSPQLNKQAP